MRNSINSLSERQLHKRLHRINIFSSVDKCEEDELDEEEELDEEDELDEDSTNVSFLKSH
jgi:hypothetical protein